VPFTLILYITFNIVEIESVVVKENGGCTLSAVGIATVRKKGCL
jgi:hypothetical protein